MTTPPVLLFAGEYPPSNHHGGSILLRRLLDKYPSERLIVITSTEGMAASSANNLLDCQHIVMPNFRHVPVPRTLAILLELASVASRTLWRNRPHRAQAIVSIVQGRYYLAAALAAWLGSVPHIIIVHDNFLSRHIGPSGLTRRVKRYLTRKVLQQAAHIYTVSAEMQRIVSRECGVNAEIQMPATTGPMQISAGDFPSALGLRILFAGQVTYTVRDSLNLLVAVIKSGQLEKRGLQKATLHLCAAITDADMRNFGWLHEDVICRGWLSQSELRSELATADILFLPYSFRESARDAVESAFPSKTADYLAAGKPLLVFGPAYSTLVRYASEWGFAEVVTECDASSLMAGIVNLASSETYRRQLAARSAVAFQANHDIQQQRARFYEVLETTTGAGLTKETRLSMARSADGSDRVDR